MTTSTMADPQDLLALAAKIEAATGPDRDLDALIAPLAGLRIVDEGHPLGRCCYDAAGQVVVLPSYTRLIDAAMTLVPEGYIWGAVNSTQREPEKAEGGAAFVNRANGAPKDAEQADAATPALALCAAALRARAAIREGESADA